MLILLWFRQRGFVFWFSTALVIVTIGTLIGMLAFIGESQGNVSFRFLKAKPDLSVSISASPQTAERNGSLILHSRGHQRRTWRGQEDRRRHYTCPPASAFTSAQPADPACFESEGVVNCRLGALDTTKSVKAIISVTVGESAPQTLVATTVVETSLPDTDPSNDSATVSTPVK